MSIVTQTVTVVHTSDLLPSLLKSAIEDVGFDIVETPKEDVVAHHSLSFSQSLSRIPSSIFAKRRQHLSYCAQCRAEHGSDHTPEDGPSNGHIREIVGNEMLSDAGSQKGSEITCTAAEKLSHPVSPPHDKPAQADTRSAPLTDDTRHVTLSIGGMTCAACTNTITDVASNVPGVSGVVVNLLGHSATATVHSPDVLPDLVTAIEDAGYDAEVVESQPTRPVPQPIVIDDGSRRLTLSVGGMTCAACTTTITNLVSAIDGVQDVSVNLLGKSATVIVKHENLVPQVVEVIEDAGYDADLVSIEPLKLSRDNVFTSGPRSIALRVAGMFCQ